MKLSLLKNIAIRYTLVSGEGRKKSGILLYPHFIKSEFSHIKSKWSETVDMPLANTVCELWRL